MPVEYSYSEAKSKIDELISGKKSFVIVGLGGDLFEASKFAEKAIETRGLKCRVYTRNRSYAAGALSWTGAGLVSLVATAAHNAVTFNPDYEIGRAVVDNKLYIDYKK